MATFKKTGKYKQKQFNCYSNVLFRKILKEIEATNSQLQQLFVLYFTCISGKTKLFSYPLWFSVSKNNCFYFKSRNIWRQSSWREIVFIK